MRPLETVVRCFCSEEAIERVTCEAVEDAYRDNVKYLELSFSFAFVVAEHKLSLSDVIDGLVNCVKLAEKSFPTKVALTAGIPPPRANLTCNLQLCSLSSWQCRVTAFRRICIEIGTTKLSDMHAHFNHSVSKFRFL